MVRPVDAAAFAIADNSEGCVLTTYRDPSGIPTAGFGHTGKDVVMGKTYTMTQALAWRAQDMARAGAFVETHVRVPLNDNQYSALAEFTYNVGVGNFLGSTLLRLLNAGNYDAVPAQLIRWDKAGGKVLSGLVARRTHEAALFAAPATHTVAVVPKTANVPSVCGMAPTPQAPSLVEHLRAWWHTEFGAAQPV